MTELFSIYMNTHIFSNVKNIDFRILYNYHLFCFQDGCILYAIQEGISLGLLEEKSKLAYKET